MIEDFCDFFQKIEADPEALVSGLTIRDYLMARQHLAICESCQRSVDRTLEHHPEQDTTVYFGAN